MIPRATATTTESTKRPVVKTVSIGATFAALKKRGQCAFIPFICAGDPNLDATERAIAILDDEGADVIELGVPYSDPLADGPTIAQAATRALNAGTTLDKTLALLARVSPTTKAPIVLFTYFNPIYQRGFEAFVEAVAAAGAKGLLVPDIPLEETPELSAICAKNGVDLVLLSTPTTPEARMTKIAEASNGFIYLVSVTGVTGVRTNVESRVQELVSGLKKVTDKPVAVGFGISKKEQAAQVVGWGADGVIVGSALVRALGEAPTPEEGLERLTALAKELREGSNREGAKPAGKSGGASFFDRIMGKA
ncbi:uncharacterized protein MICPUCDRAFT_35499 [Micromonas pusilla CCMP1545]|uniref:Predicted protein n=1 Tax=Micromonas pusilla (strain CCMP1545) TaxID=564608 RepID=C1N2K9_MICPC|nr:uncharacterized protein MICPUCDRAFT_35499 [Micromonas pusilla CCMP1545]EEH53604.1 predicted protein [Micromonas pusilla CCMP1545]|eukprot:XP_003061892.1 predicted protein [Micromonas pusilla CCMP1545]